ncbi:MAG: hypothetical protein QHH07_11445 [Sedimentisphaerales bacterium]|nr:hypothetical protein [Sedimentisphaerales bacterium]
MLIDSATGTEIKALNYANGSTDLGDGFEYSVYDAVISPDGKWIATTGEAFNPSQYAKKYLPATLWDVASGQRIRTIGGLAREVVFSNDNKFLLSLFAGETKWRRQATLWDVSTGGNIQIFGQEQASSATFSPDGRMVAVGRMDGKVELWSLEYLGIAELFKRDQFETTDEYAKRVKGLRLPYSHRVTLGVYDADRGGFEVEIEGVKVFVPIAKDRAKEMVASSDSVYIRGDLVYAYEDVLELVGARLSLEGGTTGTPLETGRDK